MSTRPNNTDAPVPLDWAEDAGAIVENPAPSPAVREVGWVPSIPPAAGRFNWLLRAMSRQLEYLMGFKADVTAGDRWGYDTDPTFRTDIAPQGFHPSNRGSGNYRINLDVGQASGVVAGGVYGNSPLPHLPWLDANRATYRIEGLKIYADITHASGQIILYLERRAKSATGLASTVASVTISGVTGGLVSANAVMAAHTIDHTYWYWLEVRVECGAAATDTSFYGAEITYSKNAVE